MKKASPKVGGLSPETFARLASIEALVIDNEPQTFECPMCEDRRTVVFERYNPRMLYTTTYSRDCLCRPAWVIREKARREAEKAK